jgi:hypothetical protein
MAMAMAEAMAVAVAVVVVVAVMCAFAVAFAVAVMAASALARTSARPWVECCMFAHQTSREIHKGSDNYRRGMSENT